MMNDASLPQPTVRKSFRFEGRLIEEQEPSARHEEIINVLGDFAGYLASADLRHDDA